jgi:hypothetical protein
MYTVEWLEQKSFRELKSIAYDCQIMPAGDCRCRQTWIDALVGTLPSLLTVLAAIENASSADRIQEPIENFPGAGTNFLKPSDCWNFADFGEVMHKADADGQLNLLEWDIDEPPDPDDFEFLDDFWVDMELWNFEHSESFDCLPESLTLSLPMLMLADIDILCDRLIGSILPISEDVEFCPCGAMSAVQCDGTTVTHIYPDRIVFTPCYQTLDAVQAESVLCDRVGGRSPPGGDVFI